MGVQRVAIMTGGGDCPGLNAVIYGAVRVGIEKYGWEVLGIEDATNGLIDLEYRFPKGNQWLTLESVRGILSRGGTILGTSNRSDPFNYVTTGPDGKETTVDVSDKVVANFQKLGLQALISIGGDGSMRIARKLMDKGIPIVGVPKTIDNDLASTDQTFGFDTAVQIATEALDRVRDTAESHDRVMIVEVMGRDAGFIALHAGIAGGADAILLPEIPYRLEPLAEMIAARRAKGQTHCVIVVAEGAKPLGGDASVLEHKAGAMPRLVGAGTRVAERLGPMIKAELRVTVLGHIQRGGSPSNFDRILAVRYGQSAADLVAEGRFGHMVALRNGAITSVPIVEASSGVKRVEAGGQLVQTAKAIGVCFGD
ncbi:MAG: ATP-dependent 6-phosphofructokinase [Deltaproteobacteria bacterium]|nr:ATP-dependent 6-phosphofructokinase [Deltaproteobacteria bacterium]